MNVINNYEKVREVILSKINKTIDWLHSGEKFGISFEEERNKLINLKENLGDSKLKIALVGAFSEGKTTMAASWLGKVESDMKIHHEESSDAISIYQPIGLEDKCVVIDTPGLFGNKEIEAENGFVKYKEITEKFVSEAHLILYVINPINLMKDSHQETCKWLFRDLGKLENTVFVINKFDDIADLEDENEYFNLFQIKKDSFVSTLDRFINLTEQETENLKIIAISANPYTEGLEYWFDNLEEFENISRINKLRTVTNDIIANSSSSVYTNQIKSVVSDLVLRKKNEVIQIIELQSKNIELSDKNLKNIENDLDDVSKEIKSNFFNLKNEIIRYLVDLKIKVRGADSETLGNIFDREIGENGRMLDLNLEEILYRYLLGNISELKKIGSKIEDEINFSEKISDNYVKSLITSGLSSVKAVPLSNMRNMVLASRNTLVKTVNSLGGDIAIKFKPWGAVKFAKGLGAAAGGITVLIEIYGMWKSYREKKKFEDAKTKLLDFIEDIIEHYEKMFKNEDEFTKEYFPQLKEYSIIHENLKAENKEMRSLKQKLENWFKFSAEIQDAEFENVL
ncbi:LeoA/HP0731 family dynamin-like GTPase [Chryseobacterium balustinum]|uniref:50S ribosome-binding GTPase n=1 Tax=Chryseobacterium balustinum TaxID=246 RepID=A0ABY1LBJ4_9FLAO|nr:LeoA/HP0731 family dynamin-like GTPase [Chryseobacterium balustinum]AZB32090.1 hypothetical protein EB354_22685 [Chryseobacterium balustinum]SKB94416.1 50S ribosome-binding GTPase [Chryseobacterium balustinum]